MNTSVDLAPREANLQATPILDFHHPEVRRVADPFAEKGLPARTCLQQAHMHLVSMLYPVYSINELQCTSDTLCKRRGSCSQRMACLESVARAVGIPTRVRALHIKGSFWNPRFRFSRWFIPRRILLVWPQFFLDGRWVDFDELHASMAVLVRAATTGFANNAESLFEAVRTTPVDLLGKTCGMPCAKPEYDLSRYVLDDQGFFDTRDEVFHRFGSFQHSLRGRFFEMMYGNRSS